MIDLALPKVNGKPVAFIYPRIEGVQCALLQVGPGLYQWTTRREARGASVDRIQHR